MEHAEKNWTPNEDEHLWDMNKRKLKLAAMAARFATTEEGIINRLSYLQKNPPKAPSAEKSEDITPKELAAAAPQPAGVAELDAIDILTNETAQSYNRLVQVLGTKAKREEIIGGAVQVEQFWHTVKDPAPLHIFLAQIFHENYIMIPRPKIIPQASIHTTVVTSPNVSKPHSP